MWLCYQKISPSYVKRVPTNRTIHQPVFWLLDLIFCDVSSWYRSINSRLDLIPFDFRDVPTSLLRVVNFQRFRPEFNSYLFLTSFSSRRVFPFLSTSVYLISGYTYFQRISISDQVLSERCSDNHPYILFLTHLFQVPTKKQSPISFVPISIVD